jgi:hypothetical protein
MTWKQKWLHIIFHQKHFSDYTNSTEYGLEKLGKNATSFAETYLNKKFLQTKCGKNWSNGIR